jgi:GntR family transcriptional regulator
MDALVSKRKLDVQTRNLVGLTDEMKDRSMYPSITLIVAEVETSTKEIVKDLGVETGNEVSHLRSLRHADSSLIAFETACLL